MRVLAIDQGTTGTTTALFGADGRQIARAYRELPQHFPQPGWVEHDAHDIWRTVVETVEELLAAHPGTVDAVGITNQRETAILWDRETGEPIHRAIVWQCRRTKELCESLAEHAGLFRERTGLPLDAYFSGTKIRWLLDHVDADPARLAFGTVDAWLVWKLTGGRVHATDPTNAARTLLFDIRRLAWDKELAGILGVPLAMMPEVRNSVGDFGTVSTIPALDGVPIAGMAGDQQAALFGQGCFNAGGMKNTYGTGCFALLNTGQEVRASEHGLLTTVAVGGDGRPCWALEGSVFIAGAAIQWLRDGLGLLADASESEAAARSVPDNAGVYLVPAFVGLGAPHWDMDARGAIVGLTRGATRAHLIRAALESMAYQTHDVVRVMEREAGVKVERLAVDGGAAANDFLMQFQADVLGCTIERPDVLESTALGAAYLAGLGVGVWKDAAELSGLRRVEREFVPALPAEERRRRLEGWQHAIRQTRTR
ncbi:glycerol kinase GlpK [bacterium]|nr:glycerol kinase GlpK [bacterium]